MITYTIRSSRTTWEKLACPPYISLDPAEIKRRVIDFIENFATRIENAPMHEKKILMKKVISRIDVDRDAQVVTFHVRRLPAVSPRIDDLLQKERVAAKVATTQSSGGPNFAVAATGHYNTFEFTYLLATPITQITAFSRSEYHLSRCR